jgi:hypothetical protein
VELSLSLFNPNPSGVVIRITSVAVPFHFYAAPSPGKNFDAAPMAPTLLYTKPAFLKQTKVNIRVRKIFSSDFLLFHLFEK